MTATAQKLLDNTALLTPDGAAEAGFSWESGEVQYRPDPKESTKVSLGKAPHMRVVDVPKFEAYFPGVILQALDGTSILVGCQAATRRRLKAVRAGAPKPTWVELQILVLNAMRGIKNRGGVIVRDNYLYGGVAYKTQAEALVVEFGSRLADLIDAGIEPVKARAIVEEKMITAYGDAMDAILGAEDEVAAQ